MTAKNGSSGQKPFLKRAVFWQALIAVLLFPLLSLQRYINIELSPSVALVLVLVYLTVVVITVFWSLSNFLSDIVQKMFSWQSVVPLVLSLCATYTLFAATYGWWPFLPNAI